MLFGLTGETVSTRAGFGFNQGMKMECEAIIKSKLSPLIAIFLIFILLMSLPACKADGRYQKLPVVVPFQLHKENTIAEVYFKITKEDVYSYNLYFKRTPEDGGKDKVLALMQTRTESKITDGVPIAVSLDVYRIEGQNEILDTQWGTQSLPLFGSVTGNYSKEIYAYTMSPGKYKAILKTVKANPEFSEVPVNFRVGLANRPK